MTADVWGRSTPSARPPAPTRSTAGPRSRCWPGLDVPGFGWATWRPGVPPAGVAPVVVDTTSGSPALANGLVTVEVDPADGTFAVDGRGAWAAWSTAATGATPTTGAPRRRTRWSSGPTPCRWPSSRPDLRGRLAVTATYRWPASSTARAARARSPRGAHRHRAAGGRGRRSVSRSRSTTAAATTGCGRTSRSRGRPTGRTPSAPSPWSSGGSRPRAGRPRRRSPPTPPSGSSRPAG